MEKINRNYTFKFHLAKDIDENKKSQPSTDDWDFLFLPHKPYTQNCARLLGKLLTKCYLCIDSH